MLALLVVKGCRFYQYMIDVGGGGIISLHPTPNLILSHSYINEKKI